MRLFDTAGLRRKARITETAEKLSASDAVRAIRFAEVVVLLIDAEHPFEKQDLTIAGMVDRGRPRAGDRRQQVGPRRGQAEEAEGAARGRWRSGWRRCPACRSSPSRRSPSAASKADGRGDRQPTRSGTAACRRPHLNRWLGEALERHAPPAARGRRIKIRFMTQPSTRPPTFVAFCSQPEALPKSYLRYLTNSLRDGLRPAGRADPLQAAQGREPVRAEAGVKAIVSPPPCGEGSGVG